mmetsp:Transcript_31185/g.47759  ORF Transcript_31185/g.47759 Transcript_31185/m.47759 type:complete len:96 (+) Transcript_31185:231-518(+)
MPLRVRLQMVHGASMSPIGMILSISRKKWDDGCILLEQSAALIYGATSTAEASEDSVAFGRDANVGWFYILKIGVHGPLLLRGLRLIHRRPCFFR